MPAPDRASLWIQMTFWLTLAALADVGGDRSSRFVGRAILVVAAIVAGTSLLFGGGMVRSWDDTEVRELILPFGLALAGFEMIRRHRVRVTAR